MMLSGIIVAIIVGWGMSVILVRCVHRMPDDQKIWSPPLQCSACHKNLPWITHFPLLGYFLSHGKCLYCQHPLSSQNLWIEFCTLFGTIMMVLWRHETSQLLIDLVFLYTLIVIAFIDWNMMIIEPRVIVLAIAVRLVWLAWFELHSLLYYLSSMCIAAGAFYFIGFIYETLRKRQGLGDGDAAVVGVIALWIGWEALSITVLIAALSGLLIGGGLLVLKKRPLATTRIPFAPFLCAGGGIVYYIQDWMNGFSRVL